MKVLQRALAAGAVVLLAACTAPEFGPEGPGETFDPGFPQMPPPNRRR